ncbi:MAG: MFS transporter [Acidimicrobiales bacterium]
MMADFVYEGARAVIGPYLATLGASAAVVGVVTGAGEAVALVFRMVTGRMSDRTGRHWALSIGGYALTAVSVPLLALSGPLWSAVTLTLSERLGKAVRTPARDTMLAQAGVSIGRGWAFAVHEALDQTGALAGPLLVALMLAVTGSYRVGFAVLAAPGMVALVLLARLRARAPMPAAYDSDPRPRRSKAGSEQVRGAGFSRRFWNYAAFTALSVTGYSTFAVLSYHLQVHHILSAAEIPLVYAVAMAAAALAGLASGRVYDRIGLRGLVALPFLSAAVPFLSFSLSRLLVFAGALVWGAAMGLHESTMRAAVADLVPARRRGAGYGMFTAVYGTAWLAGSAAIGALYGYSIDAAITFTVVMQALALMAFVPLLLRDPA